MKFEKVDSLEKVEQISVLVNKHRKKKEFELVRF
jgi:hypothetical protein